MLLTVSLNCRIDYGGIFFATVEYISYLFPLALVVLRNPAALIHKTIFSSNSFEISAPTDFKVVN